MVKSYLEPECPDGYEHIPHLSDGRTCHGIIEEGEGDFETSTCDSGNDILRKKYTPMNPLQIDRFRRHFRWVKYEYLNQLLTKSFLH